MDQPGPSRGPKRLKASLKANQSPNTVDQPPLSDKNTQLGTSFTAGKEAEMERLDSSQTSDEEFRHSLNLNNIPAPLNAPRLLLIAIFWSFLETMGLALEKVMPQLCQVCWAPSALRLACGHAGLCVSCGGGDEAGTCRQCYVQESDKAEQEVTDEYKAGKSVFQISDDRFIVTQQRFLTYTLEEAVQLSRKDFDNIPFHRILGMFHLNGLFKGLHFDKPEHARSLLRCRFLACTEVKCRLCGIRSRVKARECKHESWCHQCLLEINQERCLACGIDIRKKGYSVLEHSVVPTANLLY